MGWSWIPWVFIFWLLDAWNGYSHLHPEQRVKFSVNWNAPSAKSFHCYMLSEHCSPVCQTVSWLPQMETFKLYYKCWVSKCTYCTNLQTVCFKSGQRKWKIVSDHPCTIKHCYTHTILMSVWWFFKLWFIELSWLNTVTLLLGNYCRILGWNW